uniref:Uncharacterized protein n=1 Tax=Lactuca sativa TaxID=4236 RepID=A0A9R1UFC7_LACSA|nr:hypothetical protein LSAT_V11C900487620 [Lactuca sativa]
MFSLGPYCLFLLHAWSLLFVFVTRLVPILAKKTIIYIEKNGGVVLTNDSSKSQTLSSNKFNNVAGDNQNVNQNIYKDKRKQRKYYLDNKRSIKNCTTPNAYMDCVEQCFKSTSNYTTTTPLSNMTNVLTFILSVLGNRQYSILSNEMTNTSSSAVTRDNSINLSLTNKKS